MRGGAGLTSRFTAAQEGLERSSCLPPLPLHTGFSSSRDPWIPAPPQHRSPARADAPARSALICGSFGSVRRNCPLPRLLRACRPLAAGWAAGGSGTLHASPLLQPELRLSSAGPRSPQPPLKSGCVIFCVFWKKSPRATRALPGKPRHRFPGMLGSQSSARHRANSGRRVDCVSLCPVEGSKGLCGEGSPSRDKPFRLIFPEGSGQAGQSPGCPCTWQPGGGPSNMGAEA